MCSDILSILALVFLGLGLSGLPRGRDVHHDTRGVVDDC